LPGRALKSKVSFLDLFWTHAPGHQRTQTAGGFAAPDPFLACCDRAARLLHCCATKTRRMYTAQREARVNNARRDRLDAALSLSQAGCAVQPPRRGLPPAGNAVEGRTESACPPNKKSARLRTI